MIRPVDYVPDAVFASDNVHDVPLLDRTRQAEYLESPIKVWGTQTRRHACARTWMFYAKDYKFTAVWKHPESVLTAQPSVIIEPNFSTSQDMPAAVALYGIFRKRWLARYWQMRGVQIVVDLCVAERFTELNLLGVPVGWSSFATRVMRGHHNAVEQHYAAACRRAKGTPKLFVVCGGGQTWQTTCQQRGWLWIPEQMSEVRLARKARELEKSGEVVA